MLASRIKNLFLILLVKHVLCCFFSWWFHLYKAVLPEEKCTRRPITLFHVISVKKKKSEVTFNLRCLTAISDVSVWQFNADPLGFTVIISELIIDLIRKHKAHTHSKHIRLQWPHFYCGDKNTVRKKAVRVSAQALQIKTFDLLFFTVYC